MTRRRKRWHRNKILRKRIKKKREKTKKNIEKDEGDEEKMGRTMSEESKKGGDKGSKDIKGNKRECWTKR